MNSKKILLGLFLLLFGFSLFATGNREGYNNECQNFKDLIESKEKVVVTGKIYLENRILPEIYYGDEKYKIFAPPYHIRALELKDGEEVTVEGIFIKPPNNKGRKRFLKEDEEVLFVTKATINGKVYDLEKYRDDKWWPHPWKMRRRSGYQDTCPYYSEGQKRGPDIVE